MFFQSFNNLGVEIMESFAIGGLVVIILLAIVAGVIFLNLLFRVVVPTNMVHIVQSKKLTTSYGKDKTDGNVYMDWPSWFPFIGVTVIKLPVSNFDLSLEGYEAYDSRKVGFRADVTAFFRVADTTLAAQRVSSVQELEEQLRKIVQGAVRRVLAGATVEEIMVERAKFGDEFTAEVQEQLKEWGVATVKAMELMDIKDSATSKVVSDIMAKQTSTIDRESRTAVAENKRAAEMAEIEAQREVDIQRQQAEQAVGERTAEKVKAVGIADEQARQQILLQQRETTENDMAVRRVEEVRAAEILKDKMIVAADQDKATTVIIADGQLEAERKRAQGIEAVGLAEASAKKAMELAPVQAAIELAKEIGQNPEYQSYLQVIEAIKAYLVVGQEQAKALQGADVKIISNAGSAGEGMGSVMDLFTSKGGTHVGSAIEAFAQTPLGKQLMDRLTTVSVPSAATGAVPNGDASIS